MKTFEITELFMLNTKKYCKTIMVQRGHKLVSGQHKTSVVNTCIDDN